MMSAQADGASQLACYCGRTIPLLERYLRHQDLKAAWVIFRSMQNLRAPPSITPTVFKDHAITRACRLGPPARRNKASRSHV